MIASDCSNWHDTSVNNTTANDNAIIEIAYLFVKRENTPLLRFNVE